MARSGSAWSVKGIDAETRAVARSRAGASDLTIGSWINQAILNHAGEPIQGRSVRSAPRNVEYLGTGSEEASTAPAAIQSIGGLGERDLLDLINQELEASRDRLDQSLRPVGFALKDLALRLVAAEALQRGDQGAGDVGSSRFPRAGDPSDRDTRPDPASTEGPCPPLGSLAPPIDPEEIPPPLAANHAPSPPTGGLTAAIHGVEPPPHGTRPAPIAPIGNLSAVQAEEMPAPPPPRGTRSEPSPPNLEPEPTSPGIRDTAPPSPVQEPEDTGVTFTGLQRGFESDPDLAVVEARADTGRKTIRAMRIAAGLAPFIVIGALTAGYFLAEPLGIAPLRDEARKRLTNHASATEKTLGDAYHAALGQFERLTSAEEPSSPTLSPPRPEPSQRTASVASVDPPTKTRISRTVAEAEKSQNIAAPPPTPKTAPPTSKPRVSNSRGSVLDDPPIANLGARDKPKSENPVVVANPPSRASRLATLPPSRPALAKNGQTSVQKPKARTKLAALPVAPPLSKDMVPSSKLDGKALIASLRGASRAGDPRAQHELGRRLIQGDGVARDFAAGSEWFREAAIQGVSNAQYNLAVLYERGLGVTKDDVRALLWYHSAAEQSHPLAQYNLGIFYLQGRGIPLSYAEAARWFTAASNQGVARATYNLAVLTEDGLGVPPNREKAITLYEQASRAGHHEATNRLVLLRGPNAENTKPATFEETADTQAEGASTGTTVADIQAYLRRGGMYNGRIDGIAGPKTRTAIREYQRRHALPITGIPSEILLDYMKASAASGATKTSASG